MKMKQLQNRIDQAKRDLEMTDEQLAKHLRIPFDAYMEVVKGRNVLTVVKRRAMVNSINRLYKRCGLEW